MKDFKRYVVARLSLSICAVLLLGGAFLYLKSHFFPRKTDQYIQEKEALVRLLQNSSEIHRLWSEGEDSREWSLVKQECLNYFKMTKTFDESLLRCNPMLIQCNYLFNPKLNYRLVTPAAGLDQNTKLYRYLTKSNNAHMGLEQSGYLFTIEDKISHKQLNLLLEDQCHEVFLPNRIYAYGEEIIGARDDGEDYRFDNFNQNIYIDRKLVTNAEVNDWIDFGNANVTENLKKREGDELLMPATHLTYSQMENFCSSRGKQIMQAHYFHLHPSLQ